MSEKAKDLNYIGFDHFRIIAAILVIAIHTSPLLTFSKTGDLVFAGIIARVAVPFFFMITGFFLFSNNLNDRLSDQDNSLSNQDGSLQNQERDLSDQIKEFSFLDFLLKNAKLYGIAILLYLPLSIYAGYFNQAPFFPELLKDIVFNGTFYHLWYFPAVILGTGIVVLLLRAFRFKITFFVTFLLYLIGLMGDSYYGFTAEIPLLRGVYHILFQCFDYTRNGLFFTPLYLMLGIWLSKNEPLSRKHCIRGFVISMTLMIAEGLLLHFYSEPRHDSMYLMLPFSMFFLFQLLIHQKGSTAKGLRRVSLIIYIIHPWCIVLVRGFAKLTGVQAFVIENSVVFFLIVSALSVILSIILCFIWSRRSNWLHSLIGKNILEAQKTISIEKGRAWAEIDRSKLRYNLVLLEQLLPADCQVMAVVKANAYGHGAVPIASELQAFGVNAFAVASMEEGILLRKKGITGTILILGYTQPENIDNLLKYRLVQTVVDYNHGVSLNQMAVHSEKKLLVHLKIDTGMHRLGEDHEHYREISDLFQLSNLTIDGLFTHLCVADSSFVEDIRFTRYQLESFYRVVDFLDSQGYPLPAIHVQSSYGLLNYPELHCSYARIGIALYGALSQKNDHTKVSVALKPVMSIRARVSIVKEVAASQTVGYGRQFKTDSPIRIATVSIGYADGIPRNLTDGKILINGIFAPVIGRICMDQLTVDVSHIPEVKQGDIATIIGQDGNEVITPEQFAKKAETITNEFFSRLGDRLERIYI